MFGAMTRKRLIWRLALGVVLGSVLGSPVSARGQEAGGDVATVYEDPEAGGDADVVFEAQKHPTSRVEPVPAAGGDADVVFEVPPPEVSEDTEPAGSAEKASPEGEAAGVADGVHSEPGDSVKAHGHSADHESGHQGGQ